MRCGTGCARSSASRSSTSRSWSAAPWTTSRARPASAEPVIRSAAAHLLPAALIRFGRRHPKMTVDVRVVPDLGRGIAGEVLDGRADVGMVTLPVRLPGLVTRELFTEPYVLVHPAGHPDPRALPMIAWHENCSTQTRRRLAAQDWIPPGDMTVQDDSVVLSMIGHGLGAAIVPRLTVAGAGGKVAFADLGADAPMRRVGSVTTPETAASAVVRDLIADLASVRPSFSGSGSRGDSPMKARGAIHP
ncbi:substrate-binding domain-containing protein [Nonomuraea sp. NPDC049480]|uniref:substrate-binding domain-containing protein n=1 Tax=Nonomuraea sp. NPDC049480 TaxID=3364353 RepID=UPI0037B6B317